MGNALPKAAHKPPVTRHASGKISSKGQITLPAAMRRELGTDRVLISMQGDTLTIKPQRSLQGALAKYAQPGRYTMEEETELAWDAVVRDYAKANPRG